MKWNEWFEGIDLEQPYGNLPMVGRRWTLWKWLEMSDLIKPYQNEWIQWEMNEVKWIEWNEWFDGNDLEQPYGKVPMVDWECPYQSDWNEPYEKVPIKMNGIDEKWMNRGRISEIKWNEWFDGFDLEQPYGKVPMVDWECPYQNDLNEPYENVPIKMIRFDWIEVNRTIWGDMSELKEVS